MEIRYVNSSGEVVETVVRGRGRLPAGAKMISEGVYEAPQKVVDTSVVKAEYVTLDLNGKVIRREAKGRGRVRSGYVLQAEGANAGHFVGTETITPAVKTVVSEKEEA